MVTSDPEGLFPIRRRKGSGIWEDVDSGGLDTIRRGYNLTPTGQDNDKFLYPNRTVRVVDQNTNSPNFGTQQNYNVLKRGYIRSLQYASNQNTVRTCGFQFNPQTLTQSVQQNTQLLNFFNQDPSQFALPLPGNVSFAFDLRFDRSMEINKGNNRRSADGAITEDAFSDNYSWATDAPENVGVLHDIGLFYDTIGVGITEAQKSYMERVTEDLIKGEYSSLSDEDRAEYSNIVNDVSGSLSGYFNANLGNTAFMIPTPVRAVFSEYYMVEGFVSSVAVQFLKFDYRMVPMVADVQVIMEAKYVGFAKQSTYLTQTLEALANSQVESGPEQGVNTGSNADQRTLGQVTPTITAFTAELYANRTGGLSDTNSVSHLAGYVNNPMWKAKTRLYHLGMESGGQWQSAFDKGYGGSILSKDGSARGLELWQVGGELRNIIKEQCLPVFSNLGIADAGVAAAANYSVIMELLRSHSSIADAVLSSSDDAASWVTKILSGRDIASISTSNFETLATVLDDDTLLEQTGWRRALAFYKALKRYFFVVSPSGNSSQSYLYKAAFRIRHNQDIDISWSNKEDLARRARDIGEQNVLADSSTYIGPPNTDYTGTEWAMGDHENGGTRGFDPNSEYAWDFSQTTPLDNEDVTNVTNADIVEWVALAAYEINLTSDVAKVVGRAYGVNARGIDPSLHIGSSENNFTMTTESSKVQVGLRIVWGIPQPPPTPPSDPATLIFW